MTLERPKWEADALLSAPDLTAEQTYRVQRLRRHNRYLHGYGVVCGFKVVAENDPRRPWLVRICPGYAIGPWGDEICSPSSIFLDLALSVWAHPDRKGQMAWVGVRSHAADIRPKPARSGSCPCETRYELSRTSDGIVAEVIWEAPGQTFRPVDICRSEPVPCPDCPDFPHVVLASVVLPLSEGDPLQNIDILDGL